MNPFALLLGLFGTGAMAALGGGKGKKPAKHTNEEQADQIDNSEEQVADTPEAPTTDPTPPSVPEEPPVVVDSDPTPPSEPEEPPVVVDPTPAPPEQTGDSSNGGNTVPTVIDGTVEVMAGRVATLSPAGDDIGSVRILSGVEHGNVTVNPDNSFALVLTQSDFTGSQSFTYEVMHNDGTTSVHEANLNVVPGAQEGGWGTGELHYMLETDADGRILVEASDTTQKIYVTASDSALSRADIAEMEGISQSDITAEWLQDHQYGKSADVALDQELGELIWKSFEGTTHSNWLLFERGYSYADINAGVFAGNATSELHPIYVGAWGEGDRPVLEQTFSVMFDTNNLVVQGIHLANSGNTYLSNNIIFDDIESDGGGLVTQYGSGFTIRNTYIHDISDPSQSYIQGHFAEGHGILLENNLYDHNGWTDSYYETGSGDPADAMSHNFYVDINSSDVTIRDTISMRAGQIGLQVRPGGFLENNLVLDNNFGMTLYGGDYYGAGPIGNYSLLLDNVVTSAGGRQGENPIVTGEGIFDGSLMTSYVDNIIAHMANPAGGDEDKDISGTNHLLQNNPYYNDTIVWNWDTDSPYKTENGANTEGLDPSVMDATTIQNFAAQLLGAENGSIEALADYLRARADGQLDDTSDTDLIIRFFQEGFGIATDIRADATTLRFVPDDLGDGVRWDNRLNWDTEDLPGLFADDSVDLGGNHVVYGSNITIDALDMGPGGALSVYGGKLTLNGGITGDDTGHLNIEGAGQVWTEGSDADDLDIAVQGGRFANTGHMQNADLTATGGQTILATGGAEFDLGAGHTLALNDSDAKMGFDGDDGGMAILDMHAGATLAFSAQDGDLGEIAEFRSGALGDNPEVQSGIDLGNATLEIDLAGLSAEAGASFTLMSADEIVGLFDDAVVGGLGARDANIVIDYSNDTVTLQLSAGSGAVTVDTVGEESDVSSGDQALWDALTADHVELSETLPASVPTEEEEIDPLLAA